MERGIQGRTERTSIISSRLANIVSNKNLNVPSVPRFSSPGSPTSATTDRSMLSDVVNEMDKGLPPGQRFGMHVMEAKQLKCGKFEP